MGEIASAHVSIYPKFVKGFAGDIKAEVGAAGATAGAGFNDGFGKATGTKGGGGSGMLGGSLGAIKAGIVGLAATATIGGLADGFSSVTGAASDLNETVNKSKVIFGDNYAEMDRWSSGAARSMGLSKAAALDAAAGFGDMFSQLGYSGEAAASTAQQVVQLSADLGSFNNLPTADVADMMSAAFRGEYDSLQRLIPNINASRVETEALAMTGKESAKELTAQEKAAATLAIVQRDGARATGDFARTADDAANKQKIMAARTEELQARFGQLLTPIQAVIMEGFEVLLDIGEDFTSWMEQNPEVIDGFSSALSLGGDALKALGSLILKGALPALAFLLDGFAFVVGGIGDFLEALSNIPGFEWARDAAGKVRKIEDAAKAAADAIRRIPDKKVNVDIYVNGGGALDAAARNYRALGIMGAFASGGDVQRSGVYLVGEEGPELVRLTAGQSVIPAQETASLMSRTSQPAPIAGFSPDALAAAFRAALDGAAVELRNGRLWFQAEMAAQRGADLIAARAR